MRKCSAGRYRKGNELISRNLEGMHTDCYGILCLVVRVCGCLIVPRLFGRSMVLGYSYLCSEMRVRRISCEDWARRWETKIAGDFDNAPDTKTQAHKVRRTIAPHSKRQQF